MIEHEPSSEVDGRPPPRQTYSDKLRKLADWIDANEIGDGAIILCGIEIGGTPRIVTNSHDVLKVCFPGRAAVVTRDTNHDVLALSADGIRFEGWKLRKPTQPKKTEVTL